MAIIGKSIDLYLMDGTASGRWQATLANWNSIAYKIRRDDLKNCDDIPDIHGPGVYFLFGRDDKSGLQFVYVGEGDNCQKRISQPHGFENDSYWTEAVIFVTPDGSLNKAMIKYLENRFYTIAKDADRYIIKNGNTPTQSSLQRKVKDAMEEFIINASLVMQALGHNVFESLPSVTKKDCSSELYYFRRNNGLGGDAVGKIEDDGFWVLKGSYINPDTAAYLPVGVINLRKEHNNDIDRKRRLKKDICFGSPSYAAAFVCGKNANGLTEWKNAQGIALRDIINRDVAVTKAQDEKSGFYQLKGAICAYMQMIGGKCVVKSGSQFSIKESNSCSDSIRKRRRELVEKGFVENNVFMCDVEFDSPSTAAKCVLGRSANGRTEWKTTDGRTLKEIQEQE